MIQVSEGEELCERLDDTGRGWVTQERGWMIHGRGWMIQEGDTERGWVILGRLGDTRMVM